MQSADLLADSACNTRQPSEKNHPKCNKIYFQRVVGCFFPFSENVFFIPWAQFSNHPKNAKIIRKIQWKIFPTGFWLHEYKYSWIHFWVQQLSPISTFHGLQKRENYKNCFVGDKELCTTKPNHEAGRLMPLTPHAHMWSPPSFYPVGTFFRDRVRLNPISAEPNQTFHRTFYCWWPFICPSNFCRWL